MRDGDASTTEPVQGISIIVAFVTLVTTLVVVTAVIVLLIVQSSASRSVGDLLREKAEIISYALVERVRSHLEPVAAQSAFTAQMLRDIDLDQATTEALGSRLSASLAGVPQVSTIALVDDRINLVRSFRKRPPGTVVASDWSDDPGFSGMIRKAWSATEPYWGPLFYAESSGSTLLNYIAPIRSKAGRNFVLVSSVSLDDLSDFVRSLQSEMTGQAFILFGRDAVLAPTTGIAVDDRTPLPRLASLTDTPLSEIWSEARRPGIEAKLANEIEARVVRVGDESVVFLFRELAGYGEKTWYVGSHFSMEELSPHLSGNRSTIVTGLAIIAMAALAAFLLSRIVSRPIRQLAVAARWISQLRSSNGIVLPRSVFAEINEVNSALKYTDRAIRSLQAYVPRTLARRLVERGDPTTIESEEHDITVLFTDMVDFTGMAERRSPADIVRLLNAHFTLLADCIEAEHGIVDKFIGDSTMAFWGGLETDDDHAVHACRAALRVAEAMHHANGVRRAKGERPVHLRIGIHSGRAMVGNIGSSGRINYTVIGDSVNTAERLERLARDISAEADVVTLISGDTAMRLGQEFLISPIGRRVLHGRHDETEVFILKSGEEAASTGIAGDGPPDTDLNAAPIPQSPET